MRAVCSKALFGAVLAVMLAGPVAAALEVDISGLPSQLERNVRAYLSIAKSADQDDAAALSAEDVQRLNREAPAEIRAALQPFGYYDPTIEATLKQDDQKWVATYAIDAGKPVVVKQVDIQVSGPGQDNAAVQAVLSSISIKVGDQLNQPRYDAAKQQLVQTAYNEGFLDSTYTQSKILVDPERRTARIQLHLETGPRYYFGKISVEQNILYDSFVAKLVPVEAGEPFRTVQLLALQQSLDRSGYFSAVVVDVQRDQANGQRIPVVVHTTPRKTQDYTVGVGYGTDTGPRLSLGVELRRLNKHGNTFRSDMRLSAIEQTVAAEYRIPVQNVATDYVSLRASLGAHEIGDWDTRQLLFGTSWYQVWHGMQRSVYVSAERERYWTDDIGTATAKLLYPGIKLANQQADDPIYPRNGSSWSVDLRAGIVAADASEGFARLKLVGKLVRPIGQRMRYLLRGEYGAVYASDFSQLPPSQRFYAGGEGSVRGYAYQSLSPPRPGHTSLGGRYLFTASAELDVMIVGNYGVAFFVDAGNASDDPFPDLKVGAGIGLRWKSPVGMIGIDFAHPFDDPDTSIRLHLSIGGEL